MGVGVEVADRWDIRRGDVVRSRKKKPVTRRGLRTSERAGNGTRTRDPNLGKVVLYQLSYSRKQSSIAADALIVYPGAPVPYKRTPALAAMPRSLAARRAMATVGGAPRTDDPPGRA